MTDDPNQADVSERLARLEAGNEGSPVLASRRSPLMALLIVALIGLVGFVFYLLNQPEEEIVLPTATPDEFQPEGDGFGTIEPFVPPATPEPEVIEVPASVEPNAELLEQIAALQAQIEAIQNAPAPAVEEDTAAAEAMNALTAQLAELQRASEAAQQKFADDLAARDRGISVFSNSTSTFKKPGTDRATLSFTLALCAIFRRTVRIFFNNFVIVISFWLRVMTQPK